MSLITLLITFLVIPFYYYLCLGVHYASWLKGYALILGIANGNAGK